MGGTSNSGNRVILSRHLPSGAFNPTFGTGGIAHHSPPSFAITERGAAITLQPDGKIVVAGSIWRPNFFTTYRDAIEVKRYNANGPLDASFGSNGTAESFLINSDVWAADVAVDVAGNVVVVGGVDWTTFGSPGSRRRAGSIRRFSPAVRPPSTSRGSQPPPRPSLNRPTDGSSPRALCQPKLGRNSTSRWCASLAARSSARLRCLRHNRLSVPPTVLARSP